MNRRFFLVFLPLVLAPGLAWASVVGDSAANSMTQRMMLVSIQLGLLLLVAKLGNVVFERWRLPGVLGELCAGMLVGPYLLGGLPLPGFPLGLFPAGEGFAVSPELYAFCAVASVVLLFVVGLETNIQQFLKYSLAGSAVGVGGVVVSFVTGVLLTVACARFVFGHPLGLLSPQALFLGVVSTATSVGITARVLADKRKLDSPEGATILAGAVVDDVLGIVLLTLVLGFVAASHTGGAVDWLHIGAIGVKAVGIWLFATVAGLLFARHIGALLKRFRGGSSIAVMSLGLALILAGLFEEAGLAMIVGAYVMGLSLSRTDISHMIRERLMPIYTFLVPIFFAVMGMLVDFRALADWRVLVFGLLFSLVAIAAKMVGSGGVALCFNFNALGASRIGLGMVPRGEVALIVAGIGLAAGAMTAEVFGVAVLMTVTTTLLAPPLLVALCNTRRSGLRKAPVDQAREAIRFAFPSSTISRWIFDKLQDVFRSEGFFVHSLEHERAIVQLRRELDVINMWPEAEAIVFSCKTGELPYVKTAVYEVLAELKGTIQTLQEPVDVATVVGELGGEESAFSARRPESMFIHSLSGQVLCPRLKANDKEAVIGEILDALCQAGLVRDREVALADLWRREQSMSTGLQRGVAIPHARSKAVERLVCAVGLKPEGVEFDALDGQPSTIFIMTLSPDNASAPHIQVMSEISQILTPERCAELLSCTTASQMLAVLSGDAKGMPPPVANARRVEKPLRQGAAATFRLGDYLALDLMVDELQGTDKETVVDELLDKMVERRGIGDATHVRQELRHREKLMSTGLEKGVAVPHCRTDTVDTLTCAIGITRAGVDFDSHDGRPTHVVVLTLVPLSKPAPYVQFISSLVLAIDKAGVDRILAAENSSALHRLLCD